MTLMTSILSSARSVLSSLLLPGFMQCSIFGANTVAKLLESILFPDDHSPVKMYEI